MISVSQDEWSPLLEKIRAEMLNPTEVLLQIGGVVRDCTLENFGETGTNRPMPWESLSEGYAKRVSRGYATLDTSGDPKPRSGAGALKASVGVPETSGNSVSVTAESDIASYHQLGEGNNKERPFFPIDASGNLTPYCESKIFEKLDEHFAKL